MRAMEPENMTKNKTPASASAEEAAAGLGVTPAGIEKEKLKELIKEVLENPGKFKEDAKFVLSLEVERRVSGCGWVYLYGTELVTLLGEADFVTIEHREYNCDIQEKIAIIPKTLPVVLVEVEWDENPESVEYATIYVFTPDGWKYVRFPVPNAKSLLQLLEEARADE